MHSQIRAGRSRPAAVFLLLTVATLVPFASELRAGKTKQFQNIQHGYVLEYPSSWFRIETYSDDVLVVLSFPPRERSEGVVIKPGGAEIAVYPPPQRVNSLDEWIIDDMHDTSVVSKDMIDAKLNHLCAQLVRVVSEAEEGPDKFSVTTRYYCVAENFMLQISVRNWKDDPKQHSYEGVAIGILKSVKGIHRAR